MPLTPILIREPLSCDPPYLTVPRIHHEAEVLQSILHAQRSRDETFIVVSHEMDFGRIPAAVLT